MMTNKVYRSAMGKTVDMGALVLRNEHTRAVGNQKVNARGDVLDGTNRIIDKKTQQAQRQYKRQAIATPQPTKPVPLPADAFNDMPVDDIIDAVVPTNLKGNP
ncbi:hypothetical protein UFOVP1146_230 [uncultured Caudovirales phage]|uniref:Uncharacterized protein n=1 Tax=uncultured Caudovirales phage TaxID=2100421 RepID=A0A6J5P789_9CAUD|nr:hypothetical protein UFOVP812_143 [uncultured Caudovirales phage]CAB4165886.1 hypothetical protein UFOVP818_422 [uncultured Caudovirales phage]CAB4186884.1 hypothetical protein UFOVP1146_230 [uncultured Caudovirales phage]CAB4221467.1 hypothetical protein UFOVP1638_335 [uncultured Caudovirales phage]